MSWIDDRGRLFGTVNLIDALVGLVVLVLLPLGYGAYLLFRTPVPKIASIDPPQVTEKEPSTLKITGQDLRPYLHAKLNAIDAGALFVQSPSLAELKMPTDLAPGVYDVTLYNEGQLLVSKPGAVTVVPVKAAAPRMNVQAIGEFVNVSKDDEKQIRNGSRFVKDESGPIAQVLAVKPAEPAPAPNAGKLQMPGILRLICAVAGAGQCKIDDLLVTPNATVSLPRQNGGALSFHIDEVRPATSPVIGNVRVHFLAKPEVVDLASVGDVDLTNATMTDRQRATLTSMDAKREHLTVTTLLGGTTQVPQAMVAFEAVLRVPMVDGPEGWTYDSHLVKTGASINFDTMPYSLNGWILDVRVEKPAELPAAK